MRFLPFMLLVSISFMISCSSVGVCKIAPRLRVFILFVIGPCWSFIFLVSLLNWFLLILAVLLRITFSVLSGGCLSIVSAAFTMTKHLFSIVVVIIVTFLIRIELLYLLLLIVVLIVPILLIIICIFLCMLL